MNVNSLRQVKGITLIQPLISITQNIQPSIFLHARQQCLHPLGIKVLRLVHHQQIQSSNLLIGVFQQAVFNFRKDTLHLEIWLHP
ncbi:hypothetical protein GALL_516020 [mine drainage metagenome]|uniref:Uncharacterized protein n=1 Tax=mine drainage metagenome TaxID=410659 RepID=A0A1J5P5K9_9ZZZZ